jgi:dihydrofolate reductase
MSKVTTGATMSVDGYIAGPDDSHFDLLFRWYANGPVVTETVDPELSFSTTEEDAETLRSMIQETGCLVVGRHLYDLTNAWGGRHPMDVPCVVLTHNPPADRPVADENFVFVTEGIEAAVAKAKEIAGEKNVGLNGGTIATQALAAGLVDEVHVDLVPFILGDGTPFFGTLADAPLELVQQSVVESVGVTHITYTVVRKPAE